MTTPTDDEVQARVREVVGAVLGVGPTTIRPDDDLFDHLGYDSLAVVQVLERVERIFDVEVPGEFLVVEQFHSVESIAALMLRIRSSNAADPLCDRR